MEVNINKLMKGHSWKMSEEEIHDDLVKLGYIIDYQLLKTITKKENNIMDFGDAIKAIKNGHRVKREDWGGFWYLPKNEPQVNDQPMNKMIVAVLKDEGGYAPASPYMADMLADDWVDLDDKEEKPKPKTLEEKKEDFYHFLQLLKRIFKIDDVSGFYSLYTVKIKDKYVRFNFGTHSYYLADTDEHNSFSDSSVLSLNEVIEGLQTIFTSYNYNLDKKDIVIYNATKKGGN